jgi:hypothetical protein
MASRAARTAAAALCAVALMPVPAAGWLFDRGLEETVTGMRALFRQREFMGLYDRHVDPRLRAEIEASAPLIKKDRANGALIAKRLRFAEVGEFYRADARKLVEHFFLAMKDPPRKKGGTVRNAEYLKMAFSLTVLFAHFDDGMYLVKREIEGSRARLFYRGNNLKMIAYFAYRDNRWYLTRKGL